MRASSTVVWLSSLIVLLALVAAGSGLFWSNRGEPFWFTTIRGQTVQISGNGLYQYRTALVAVGFRMADAVTLVLAIPLLVVAVVHYCRGSRRGGLLLAGALAYFVYTYGSVAFGAAYTPLFLVYVVLFSASLSGLVLTLTSIDMATLQSRFAEGFPWHAIAVYLVMAGVVLVLVWLVLTIMPAQLAGRAPPEVASYTTFVTGVVDLGVIVRALVAAGAQLLRRQPLGYLLSATMLVFTAILGPSLTLAGIAQLLTGLVSVSPFIGFTAGFTVLTLFAIWFTIALFRNVSGAAAASYLSRPPDAQLALTREHLISMLWRSPLAIASSSFQHPYPVG